MIAPALREAVSIINLVDAGTFQPDCTRSGRFVTGLGEQNFEVAGSLASPSEVEEHLGSHSIVDMAHETVVETDSSSDANSVLSDVPLEVHDSTPLLNLIPNVLRPSLVRLSAGLKIYRHVDTLCIHVLRDESQKFVCGRHVSDRYELRAVMTKECSRCITCFLNKEVKTATIDG